MSTWRASMVAVLSIALLAACTFAGAGVSNATMTPVLATANVSTPGAIALPTPQVRGTLTLEEALAQRRSVRAFSDAPLTPAELGQLLWAAQGMTHPSGLRTAPSAGALYPLEVYAVTGEATYHYQPEGHRVTVHIQGDVRPVLHAAALRQDPVLNAPAVIVIAAVYARTAQKYATDRSPRYVHLEAGHAAQNILLEAVALNLGAVPIGAFEDEKIQQALKLPTDQQPLYLIPVGHPK